MVSLRRSAALAAALLLAACGTSPSPTPGVLASPSASQAVPAPPASSQAATPSPAPTPSPLPLPVSGTIPAAGGALAVPGGAAVSVPEGALKAPATATITASAATAGPTGAWPADAVGPTWTVDLGSAKLAKPATLTLPYDPAALPAGVDPASILLAYRGADGGWTAVPSTVDPAARTVSAKVGHLSDWGLFTINWDYWLGFIGKAASGNLTDLLGAVQTLTTKCSTSSGAFKVDNTAANGLLKGCIQKVASGTATVGVTNMRAVWFALSGAAVAGTPVIEPGDTVTFKAGGAKLAQPLVAGATLTPATFGYQLTDLVLRLLPGSGAFTASGSYGKVLESIVTAEDKVWTSAHILAKLEQDPPDAAGAAEEAFKLLTDATFLTVLVEAAAIAGEAYGVPLLAQLTPELLTKTMLAANLLILIGTLLSWDVQYFLAAYGETRVSWLNPPAAPTGLRLAVGAETTKCDDPTAPPGTTCIPFVFTWTRPPGAVSGYYFGAVGFDFTGAASPATCKYDPKQDKPGGMLRKVAAAATSHTVDVYGGGGPYAWICAFNSAGVSPPAVWK